MSSVRTPRVAADPAVDDIAGSEDNDSRLLVGESDASIETGKNSCARRRVGIVSTGMLALGLIALWSIKSRFTVRRTLTREEFQAQMKKFDVMNPYSNFNFSNLQGMTMGTCVIDADEANAAFGKFLVATGKAQDVCAGDNMGTTDCVTDVLEIFGSLGWVGDFIASAAEQCGMSASAAAGCSAEIIEISTRLVDTARQALELNRSCLPQYKDGFQQSLDAQYLFDIPQCLVDIDLLAAHATKGGILTGELAQECKDSSSAGQLGCAVDIIDLLSQLGDAGTFLSAALVDCAPQPFAEEVDAMCAESIAGIVGNTFGVVADAAVINGCAGKTDANQTR